MTKTKEQELSLYEQLSEDFAADALTADTSRGFALTSIKPQYIKERLNTVVGIDGWKFRGEYVQVDGGVIYLGALTLVIDGTEITHEAPGFAAHKRNLGDTYKGAQTDALSKCASFFGIGNEVFKGNVTPPETKSEGSASALKSKRANTKWNRS